MGYETKLIIGKSCQSIKEIAKENKPQIDGDSLYYPLAKDDNGEYIYTGRIETYFMVYAVIDLCKCDDVFSGIDWANKDKTKVWYWYAEDGNTKIKDDRYGDESKPVPIKTVLSALKSKESTYRRYKWAIALLESMSDDPEDLEVLFYGH